MNHLSQEDLVLNYYGELDSRAHLATCVSCSDELSRLARLLDGIQPEAVPEPGEDYGAQVWSRVSWRLRSEKKKHGGTRRASWLAAAAMIPIAFIGGLLINRLPARDGGPVATVAETTNGTTNGSTNGNVAPVQAAGDRDVPPNHEPSQFVSADEVPGDALAPLEGSSSQVQLAASTPRGARANARRAPSAATRPDAAEPPRDRILLVVVGDHFDESERVLIELTNLAAEGDDIDFSRKRERAEDLLASNRLYRRTALDRGEEAVATLLDELEPVLMQIAHSPSQLSSNELRSIQKRVESKGLVFKLRVVRADVRATATPNFQPNV